MNPLSLTDCLKKQMDGSFETVSVDDLELQKLAKRTLEELQRQSKGMTPNFLERQVRLLPFQTVFQKDQLESLLFFLPKLSENLNFRLCNLLRLSKKQTEVLLKFVGDICYDDYKETLDLSVDLQDYPDSQCDWALKIINRLDGENRLEEVMKEMSQGLKLHQALMLLDHPSLAEKDLLREEAKKLSYVFQAVSLNKKVDFSQAVILASSFSIDAPENLESVENILLPSPENLEEINFEWDGDDTEPVEPFSLD